MSRIVSQSKFHQLADAGQARGVGVFRLASDPSEPVAYAPRTRRFCFSDGSLDRMGDTINPNGWDLMDFKKNPVALWSHDSSSPPIGRASNLAVEYGRLMGDIEFATPEQYPLAETIFQLVAGGFINAVSVGFMPVSYSFSTDPDRAGGICFESQTLLEISPCSVPANGNALIEARAYGIDTRPLGRWASRELDRGRSPVSRAALLRLRDQAREPARSRGRADPDGMVDRFRRAISRQRALENADRARALLTPDQQEATRQRATAAHFRKRLFEIDAEIADRVSRGLPR